MKLNTILYISAAALAMAACSKVDNLQPEGSNITKQQLQEINKADESKADASFSGMFTKLGKPYGVFGSSTGRADDWGFLMLLLSNDVEGADAVFPDNNYNWFSVCGEYTSRTASYANPYIRYATPYNSIADANEIISQFPDDNNKVAQARAIRAYSYMELAPFFQFRWQDAKDKPCVPSVTEATTNFTQNPRASVDSIYNLILEDLNYAVKVLSADGAPARTTKAKIDASVAYGLRARAYLAMGKYELALADAREAQKGYTPASIEEMKKPAFMDISEHNWIWGYDMTTSVAQTGGYATTTSWIRSFSGDGYAPATQCYLCCNKLLYDKINSDDVRKRWWVDENLSSENLEGLTWDTATGQDIAYYTKTDVKMEFLPYTNVKFGVYTLGTTTNDEDFPLMRVEEMILTEAECLCALNKDAEAKTVLNSFVSTYRQPGYEYSAESCGGRSLANEIWFQRRVELWGEGFFVPDARRMAKPIVRTHGLGTTNQPDAFAFNIKADDEWLNMRFSQYETNTNYGIVDNTGGSKPVAGQNPELRDGVTD